MNMPQELKFTLLPPAPGSEYRWMNIDRKGIRVGKARGKADGNVLIIYSINIFPEFEGKHYGKRTIDYFKSQFGTIVADRVRPTAIGFWEKMGFTSKGDGSFVFMKKGTTSPVVSAVNS
ncbi:GNAT family protein [Methanolobus tindarius]|nr:hypothetical protein [Methanolobus tindarius]